MAGQNKHVGFLEYELKFLSMEERTTFFHSVLYYLLNLSTLRMDKPNPLLNELSDFEKILADKYPLIPASVGCFKLLEMLTGNLPNLTEDQIRTMHKNILTNFSSYNKLTLPTQRIFIFIGLNLACYAMLAGYIFFSKKSCNQSFSCFLEMLAKQYVMFICEGLLMSMTVLMITPFITEGIGAVLGNLSLERRMYLLQGNFSARLDAMAEAGSMLQSITTETLNKWQKHIANDTGFAQFQQSAQQNHGDACAVYHPCPKEAVYLTELSEFLSYRLQRNLRTARPPVQGNPNHPKYD